MKVRSPIVLRLSLAMLLFGLIAAACSPTPQITPPATLMPTSPPSQPTTQPEPVSSPVAEATPLTEDTAVSSPTETAGPGNVTAFPAVAAFDWVTIAGGLRRPTDFADPNDGSGRLLVLEQPGLIRVIADGQLQERPFLDLTDRVGANSSEQGLLGIALDPDYAENGIFYLNYTDKNGNTVVSRFRRSADGTSGDPQSEQVLLYVEQPYANHNGGDLEFGPDGYLYIGLGDGGSAGDPQRRAQNNQTLLGKMLRLDVRGQTLYAIPPDNPFADGNGGRQEIWANGLRNPWRYTFDRLTGDLYIADVGQNKYEEINFVPAGSPPGLNFGWHYREATHPFADTPPAGLSLYDPVHEYGRNDGCSVTGGYVYRGSQLPEFYGVYLFGDYCNGFVWGMLRDSNGNWVVERLFQLGANISSFSEDAQGELYLLDHRSGSIYKLIRR
ncbi:glucose/sorbosone dehydrogenases [Bellilinea caldifistulae]|uniref:PQQ-dependent sugar dehydrogenase n=1 Tax=Bellilinea caldifistulae TaxID=360411 RepID=UPI0009E26EE9|nr:PQQ-dependent sugar dehydrogenase [Bellilinea caldifistulae]GAP09534.1 glucose/sorbosone dehydrogenases [Bellilinea caldifistulae]